MSQSLASAKRRRAPASTQSDPIAQPQNGVQGRGNPAAPMNTGLTLPQVIQVIDKRLITLETFMNGIKNGDISVSTEPQNSAIRETIPESLNEVVEEFDKRYEMLAEEIVNIKNIVLSLQSYTMEVNKMLIDERVRILSDIEEVPQN
jgi:hypothetical protein